MTIIRVPKFGETVSVNLNAPDEYLPGSLGEVVGIIECDSEAFEEATGVPVGEVAIGIEFGNGVTIEVPLAWVELHE